MPAVSTNRKLLYLALALVAAAGYVTLFYLWRINTPYQDDFNDILRFLWRFQEAMSGEERLRILLEPQGNHRTAASRLVYLLLFNLQGTIDFVSLSLAANLALPVLCLLYSLVLFKGENRALSLAVAALLILSPRAYTLLHWPMTAFHFYYLLLYAALAMMLLQCRRPWAFPVAMLMAAAASFTSAGGQTVWIVGALYLAWQALSGSRGYGALILWGLTGVILVGLVYVSSPVTSPFPEVEEAGLVHFLHFTLVLLGSAVSYGSTGLAAVTGLMLCVAFAAVLYRDYPVGLHGGHFYILLLFAFAAAIALGRSDYVHVDYALTARYSFASVHLLACLALVWLSGTYAVSGRKIAAVVLAALFLCVSTYSYYGPHYESLMNTRVQSFNKNRYRVPFREEAVMRDWVEAAVKDGLYQPPTRPLQKQFMFTRPPGD